ncbi:MAG: hypothetical protein Q4D46_06100 [Erysipelotrichaceae bacterium]|nr:hypothetical protein [Solobacterium sp.]MCR5448472.1 hypothetical protein [Solobacterium sp.]MDO4194201.1 hypothetical protein [Erysipelotrichaceae bacterium]MDO5121639.1 hypothetical protein [Erysipelotrichaceae bacterium]
MIESVSDFMSVITMAGFAAAGIYLFYLMNAKHYEENMKYLEERYYRFYDESDNVIDDSIWDEPFYEENSQ